MELKEFITETIGSILDATVELQLEYEEQGIIINPPVSVKERDLYEEGGAAHTYRRVEIVEFDVAVTAASETAGGGKAGLKIFSAEAGVEGKLNKTNEEVSRVKFSIPITLSASTAEVENRDALEKRKRKINEVNVKNRRPSLSRL